MHRRIFTHPFVILFGGIICATNIAFSCYSGIKPTGIGTLTPPEDHEKNIFAKGAIIPFGFSTYVFTTFFILMYSYNFILEHKGQKRNPIWMLIAILIVAFLIYLSNELYNNFPNENRYIIPKGYNISLKTSVFIFTLLILLSTCFMVMTILLFLIKWLFF